MLKDTYPLSWEVIVDFCDIHVHLGSNDEMTLRHIANRLNGLMTAYELKVMPADKSVILIRGIVPFYDTKYPLSKHECYKFVCK
jgi:type IV secretory pathway TraG/TraD family ATPase VirD4